jgi:hypothetical protein
VPRRGQVTPTDWLVIVGGAAAIVWVNWYFFVAERRLVMPRRTPDGESGDTPAAERGRERTEALE